MKRSPGLAWLRRAVLGAAPLLALAAPAAALGSTSYCVPSTAIAGCPAGSTPETTIKAALTAANADSSSGDTVRIGPGTYPEGALVDSQAAIIGAGQGQTTIQPPAASPSTTLDLTTPAATAKGLTVGIASGANNTGISGAGSTTGVAVVAGVSSTNATGVAIGGTFASGSVSVPSPGTGIISTFVGSVTVTDSSITAGIGFDGNGTITRTRITATEGVTTGSSLGGGAVTIDDSLVMTVPGAGPETAIFVSPAGITSTTAAVTARHDTLIGDSSAGSTGISCTASAGFSSAACTATVDSSIIRGFANTIVRTAQGGSFSGDNAAATVAVDYSDLDPSTDMESNNSVLGGGTASGQITLGVAHDLNVDPAFVGGAGAGAFALTRQSTLIDAGDPVLGSMPAESTTDLAGLPRVVAGRSGAAAVSDIGAYEYQDRPPTVRASSSAPASGVAVRAAVSFSASGATVDPGDAITSVSWRFDDGGVGTGGSVVHGFTRAGRHTAVATVTDLNGYSIASAPLVVNVVGVPVITRLRFARKSISYRDSVAARATIKVQRRVGKRWVSVRSFTHVDRAGANSLRLRGRRLHAGRYRLSVAARDVAGTGKSVFAPFRVRR